MAYVPVPKDLTKVKTKVAFNLTKRQLVCFGSGALIGVPLFFLLRGPAGNSVAAMCMMLVMENNLTYTRNGDYLIPDLKLTEQPPKPLGKYGRLRKAYLKEHRPLIYNQLLMTEKLYPHLWEIDETANRRLEQMMPQLAESAGATEELKARDPMRWVGLMNTCKAQAEEILMAELINS